MADNPTIIEEQAAPAASATPREEKYVPILPGQTLEDIAALYGADVQTIVDRNCINPEWYFANQWIFV